MNIVSLGKESLDPLLYGVIPMLIWEDTFSLVRTCKLFNNLPSKIVYNQSKHKQPHGKEIERNGDTITEKTYREGVLHGPYRMLYEDINSIQSEGFWKNNRLHGLYRFYTRDKVMIVECSYESGKLVGWYKRWHINGEKMQETLYLSTPTLQHTENIDNGNDVTTYKKWNQGRLSQDTQFLRELKHGPSVMFHPNGTIMEEAFYINNKKHGVYREWNDDMSPKVQTTYADGVINGVYMKYLQTGVVGMDVQYTKGKIDGLCSCRYDNGNIKEMATYKDGIMDGNRFVFHNNGKLNVDCKYENGKLKGDCVMFDENGMLREMRQYEDYCYEYKNYSKKGLIDSEGLRII